MRKGQKASPETRERMSRAKKGIPKSPEVREKISKTKKGKKGKPRDEATRKKISEGKKKYIFTPEHLANLRAANRKRAKKQQEE